jgi:hypothetical protein
MNAYEIYCDTWIPCGSRLIFAENENRARVTCYHRYYNTLGISPMMVRARRVPQMDKYYLLEINGELDWDVHQHQRILTKELNWRELN